MINAKRYRFLGESMIKLKQLSTTFALLMILASLSACSRSPLAGINEILSGKRTINYEKNSSVKDLEVPPDLTAPEYDRSFELPTVRSGTVSLRSGGYVTTSNTSFSGSTATPQRIGNLSSIRSKEGESVLQINDTYQRSLILTDIILTRLGFAVQSRNSAGNVMRVLYNGANVALNDGQQKGRVGSFFDRTKRFVGLGSKNNNALEKGKTYQVSVSSEGGVNLLRVKGDSGQTLSGAAQSKIISLINDEFNR